MSDEQMSPEEQEELNQLAGLVAESLAKGESQADIAKKLVDNGWKQEEAEQFVGAVAINLAQAQSNAAHSSEGGGGLGWLLWIGVLLLINFLSYLFDWPFWIY